MELFLVRHGESQGNIGASDGPDPALTDLGTRQAEAVAERLRHAGLVALYSSPLRRALETARPVAVATGLPIKLVVDLSETWGLGFRGMSLSQIRSKFSPVEAVVPMAEDNWWPDIQDDELTAYERAGRVERLLREAHEDTDDRICVISHGTFGAILICRLMGLSPAGYTRFSQSNCCISMLELRPGTSKLRWLNDVCHLPPELGGPTRYAPAQPSPLGHSRRRLWPLGS